MTDLGTRRRAVAAALSAAALAGPLAARLPLAASAADPASAPIALRGTVAGVTRLAPDSVKVQITPDQQTVNGFHGRTSVLNSEVPGAMVETSGNSYMIRIDPASIPAQDISSTGIVTFNVYAEDPAAQAYSMTSASVRAVITADGGYAWTDPVGPVESVADAADRLPAGRKVVPTVTAFSSAVRGVRARVSKPTTKGVICDGEGCASTHRAVTARRVMLAGGTSRRRTRTLASGQNGDIEAPIISDLPRASSCPVGGLGVVYGGRRTVDATIGTAYPVGGDRAWMKAVAGSSNNFSASFGIAFAKGSGSGTFSQSGTRSLEQSVGFTWNPKTYARAFRVNLVYQQVQQMTGRCPGEKPDWTQEVPTGYSGGFGEVSAGVTRPNWGNCRAVSDGLWERKSAKGTSYTASGGVKFSSVIGIDLSATRAYNQEAVLSYKVHVSGRRMCGSNTYPATAGKVMERLRP